jgi:putative PIN family toxin of toxin-antitoxin system
VFRAVLDANVYISAALRPGGPPGQIIERFLRESAFEPVVSPAIVDEVLRGLRYPKVTKYIRSAIEPEPWFLGIVLLADLVPGDYVLNGVSEDPDDDKYFAAAIEGRATRLVTGDPDLLNVREHAGVRVVTPRAFLEALRESRRSSAQDDAGRLVMGVTPLFIPALELARFELRAL